MRVACVVGDFPVLSETFILNQITGLIDRDLDVDIMANRPRNESLIHSDVIKYRLSERTFYRHMPRKPRNRLQKALFLLFTGFLNGHSRLLSTVNIAKYGEDAYSFRLFFLGSAFLNMSEPHDIIHCHFGPRGLRAAMLRDAGFFKGKIITTFYGQDVSEFIRRRGNKCYQNLFRKGEVFLVLSEDMRNELINLGCNANKIFVQRLGLDCNRFSFRARTLFDNTEIRILSIGRFVEKKGFQYGIRAVAKLLRRGLDVRYNIIGDGPLRHEFETLIGNLNVDDRVRLHGWKEQKDVIRMLDDSHIFLAPSVTSEKGDKEGTPTVLIEAMATGLPVVSTRHSGIPELVLDGISGFLAPERDSDALAGKMEILCKHPLLWTKMGATGRAHVAEYHDIDKLNNQLVDIYRGLLNQS